MSLGVPAHPRDSSLNVCRMWVLGLVLWVFTVASGQRAILDQLQSLYLQQGLPFRENLFLDNLPILEEYDFVVIGSGPGGATVANRLTEIPDWKVLLLEAGQEGNIYNDIPFINPVTVLGNHSRITDVEYNDKACSGLNGGICHWPCGEAVGGATIINAMLYTRGHPSDFDEWAREGNPGWSYADLLPYFLKYENIQISDLKDSKYHGKSGPVPIVHPHITKINQRLIRACQEAGYPTVDYNNPDTMLGIARSQASMKNGKRVSAASAYLHPIKNRPNFHVTKNTPATQILINPQTKKAYGVRFRRRGVEKTVLAKKEVILSGGSFGTPKLLMLSGVGRKDHLEKLGIPVIQDLPVGDYLKEHLGTPLLSFFINASESILFPDVMRNAPLNFLQWLDGKGGVLSSNAAEVLGYIKTPLADKKADIELIFLPITMGTDAGAMIRKSFFMRDDLFEDLWGPYPFRHGFTVCPMVMYPKSTGYIRLRSKNFYDPLIINSNFFHDPYDVKVLIEGVRAVIKLTETKALKEVGVRQHTKPLKICAHHKFNSDEYWDCTIRAVPIQWHHQCGTARMGPNPRNSVVDSRLRVHGIKSLRVVDASVMPRIPGPHTMAPTYAIAEKAADLIKEDYKQSK